MFRQRGISLVELMISLFLSSLLMSALMQHYLCIKEQYNHTQQVLEQRLELQIISELIRDSTRAAGFAPCLGVNRLKTKDRRDDSSSLAAITLDEKSQALKLARMSENFVVLLKELSATRLLLDGKHVFDARYPILIADCFHAEVHNIAHSEKTRQGVLITLKKPLSFQYSAPVYLGEWIEERFLIEKNKQGKSALFYHTSQREELTAHVNYFSARLIPHQSSSLLQVTLGVANDEPILLETKVRAL
jgi:hypothetical protein